MYTSRKKSIAQDGHDKAASAERRRIGQIVHDERGNATLKWYDAPSDYQRAVLEVESEPRSLAIQKPKPTFDPYARVTVAEPQKAAGPRKDLRKLSEWIKMMRELEERKAKGDVG